MCVMCFQFTATNTKMSSVRSCPTIFTQPTREAKQSERYTELSVSIDTDEKAASSAPQHDCFISLYVFAHIFHCILCRSTLATGAWVRECVWNEPIHLVWGRCSGQSLLRLARRFFFCYIFCYFISSPLYPTRTQRLSSFEWPKRHVEQSTMALKFFFCLCVCTFFPLIKRVDWAIKTIIKWTLWVLGSFRWFVSFASIRTKIL